MMQILSVQQKQKPQMSKTNSPIRLIDYQELSIDNPGDIKNLEEIANTELKELCERSNSRLIVFPRNIGEHGDDIGKKEIISLRKSGGKAFIKPTDLLGFIGVNDTFLSIGTRFTGNGEGQEDYLLHYMLQKVLKINIFSLMHPTGEDGVLNIMAYMFPGFLAKALRQGLLKRYTKFSRNDANVKGPIDISRHIRHNIPFNGRIAYTQREHSSDNVVTQLIRHTIEFIRGTAAKHVLTDEVQTKTDVATILAATPTYDKNKRQATIKANQKRNPHPYYTSYEPLIQLCIAILEHQHIRYAAERKVIYGILFSGSWLWEEYLNNAIFSHLGFIHPDNRSKTHAIHLFYGTIDMSNNDEEFQEKNSGPRYPDYRLPKNGAEDQESILVADAKYRHHSYCGDRENLHQLITYMHITKAQKGVLVYPIGTETPEKEKEDLEKEMKTPKSIKGFGGEYYRFGFVIPEVEENDKYKDFSKAMAEEEERLRKELGCII